MSAAAPRPRSIRGERRGLHRVARALRRGTLVMDSLFDDVFPLWARRASSVHWTPVEVAVRAAKLLTDGVDAPVLLDVGAGVGKFCLVAASTVDAVVTGVEHRVHFVEVARQAAETLGVDVEMKHAALAAVDMSAVTGFYLFNPFAENLSPRTDHLDESVELSEECYWRDVKLVERALDEARPGARVVTYCGFGGTMPQGYTLVLREQRAGRIELWEKDRA